MELSGINIKIFLIFSKKKAFLIFWEMKLSYIFGHGGGGGGGGGAFLIFWEMKLSYIFGNEPPSPPPKENILQEIYLYFRKRKS